jgi:hypothetical protein
MRLSKTVTVELSPPSPALACDTNGTMAPMPNISQTLASNIDSTTEIGLPPGAFQNIWNIFFKVTALRAQLLFEAVAQVSQSQHLQMIEHPMQQVSR